jgi:two-component sensor histidine kinase
VLVALAVAVPFILLTAGIFWQLVDNERATRREAILFSARTLANAVDTLLSKQIAVAQTLATSPTLDRDDLLGFREEAERAMQGLSGGWIVLSDRDGQQLVNLARPAGAELPLRPPYAIDLQRRAMNTGQLQISDVFMGSAPQIPVVTVEIPIRPEGKPSRALSVVMDPRIFLPLFEQWNLPEGWLAALIDHQGNFIARSRDHNNLVGKPASEGFRAAARQSAEGWEEFIAVDGTALANAHVTSYLSGWVMGLAVDQKLFEAPIRRSILFAGLTGGITTLASMLLAIWAARRIASPIEQIEQGSRDLVLRRSIAFRSTGVPEVDRALEAFSTTARVLERHEQDRDEREAHVKLIMRELSHRSKNLLAIVLAIARQTARHTASFEDFEARFNSRIQALADAHDLLVEQQWSGALLHDLVNAQLSAFGLDKVACRGGPVMLRTEAVQNVALALHELATNSAKYGALSVPAGKVEIDWAFEAGKAGDRSVRLNWRETGGPPVKEPVQKGFGCFVLERVTVNALGEGRLQFNPAGLIWTCTIRPEHLVDGAAAVGRSNPPQPAAPEQAASPSKAAE